MTTNRELFVVDPTTNPLPNDGVAEVGRPRSDEEWRILEWELRNFVCTGEYERGLEIALSTYLANLDRDKQPAVWVSGFYGSGTSHFARVLEHLWVDQAMPSGVTARTLVQVPQPVSDALRELDTAGKREGGLWSAAGKLSRGAGGSIRLAFLGVLFAAAKLPTEYPTAKFLLRMLSEGTHEVFLQALERRGKQLDELRHMYVSPAVGEAVLEAIPGFASDEEHARLLLREQYPNVLNVSEEEMLSTIGDVLALQSAKRSALQCTLIVLDELQQFLDDNPTEMQPVIDLVEACSGRFGSSLLFLATGQSALGASGVVGKLQDRFTVRVHLTDTDIETVVRSVVLPKRPDKEAELRDALESVSGEIDRQLPGTTIAPSGADAGHLVPDYPLLPSRRRFWELVLKAIDDRGGLLRSQLRTTHAGAVHVAHEPLGHVIGADFLFDDQEAEMQMTRVLLRDVDQDIRRLDDGTAEGRLRSRLCAAIFLISRLPRETGADAGIRATADTLADLVVTDLPAGSAELRRRVPELLEGLVEQGKIQKVEEEYRLQTREGQEWEAEFRRRETELRANPARIAGIRGEHLRDAVERATGTLTVHQGKSKEARRLTLHYGENAPSAEDRIPVWVRDGWSGTEAVVRSEAASAGVQSPIIHLFLPKHRGDDLARAITTFTAAQELDSRADVTDEAREAQLAMHHRRDAAESRLMTVVDEIVGSAVVLMGGGTQVSEATLKDSLLKAGGDAAVRLYPRFADADHSGWGTVVRRAHDGSPNALEAVSFSGDSKTHLVSKAILGFIGSGKKGSEVRSNFAAPPYGWGKDAVDGALLTLLAAEVLGAKTDGVPTNSKQLTLTKLGVTSFTVESGRAPDVDERATFRGICQLVGVECKSGDEASKSSELIRVLVELARSAGGPAPLPEPPSTEDLEEQQTNSGNDRVIEIAAIADLRSSVESWTKLAERAGMRMEGWRLAQRLFAHANGLPGSSDIGDQLKAIEEHRTLLTDSDPLASLRQSLAAAVRDALVAARDEVDSARAAARAELEAEEGWSSVDEDARQRILRDNDLLRPAGLAIGSDDELLESLDRLSLGGWATSYGRYPQRSRRPASRSHGPWSRRRDRFGCREPL
jgi:hypothetical protein